MKKYSLIVVFSFLMLSCNGQIKEDKKKDDLAITNPKQTFSVHKEFDEDGNLIRIDSSYTYVYSTVKNDSILEKELLSNLKFHINTNMQELDSILLNAFSEDNLFKMNDFYTDHFFENNLKLQEKHLKMYFNKLDSIKNQFYRRNFE